MRSAADNALPVVGRPRLRVDVEVARVALRMTFIVTRYDNYASTVLSN